MNLHSFCGNQPTMSSYRITELYVLNEQLSKLTADHTRLLAENGDRQQSDKIHKDIVAIQKEINFREKLNKYSTASRDYITRCDSDII